MEPFYVYKAMVESVYDGDTVRCSIDLGFSIWIRNQSLRLYGIDAPELRGIERPDGIKTRDFVISKIPPGTEVIVETIRDRTEKYGRYLAIIHVDGLNLNEELVRMGLAEPYMLDE